MALRHAVLASLLDGEASGYDLSKRMDVSVALFWHVLPTQLYGELHRLEDEGLVRGREVPQERRPAKRLFSVTDAGLEELERFTRAAARPASIKDELLVKIQAADAGDMEAVARAIDARRDAALERLDVLEGLIRTFLRGRDEDTFLATAHRIGPYLNLRRGRDFERENIAWYRWAVDALRERALARAPQRALAAGSER